MFLKFYKADPCHYFSFPGFSWDAMLQMTRIRLKKVFDMYLFIEKGLRGGNSYIAKRYSKANKKYLKDYDLTKPSKYISYFDINNLYGWAMSGYLSYGGFKWLKVVDNFHVNSVSENSSTGYILEVHLEYPKKLNLLHNGYLSALEKLAVPYDTISDNCKKIADEYGINAGDVMKLIPNLGNKTNYVLYYRNLQLHFSLGMKMTKNH